MDLETELRAAMRDGTAHVHADPLVLLRHGLHRPRPVLRVAAAAAAVVVVGGAATYAGHGLAAHGHRTSAGRLTTPTRPVDPFATWGPTRGDLAGDAAFRAQVLAEWAAPTGRNRWAAITALENPVGQPRVLWAGTTPAGPAAVVMQASDLGVDAGLLTVGVETSEHGHPQLIGFAQSGDGFAQSGDGSDEISGQAVVFAPSPGGRWVVTVPTSPAATVELSASHRLVGGAVVRTFRPLTVHSGAAVADLGPGHVPGDELVRTVLAGRVTSEQSAQQFTHAAEPAAAPNLLDWPEANGYLVGGDPTLDGTVRGETEDPWLRAHGAGPAEPLMRGPWFVAAHRPGSGRLLATQVFLPGDPAHTVVETEDGVGGPATLLSDVVTDPGSRLAFAVHLPAGAGWFVGGGHAASLTAWRESGRAWHELGRAVPAAVIRSGAEQLEVRLQDGSTVRVGS